MTRSPVIHSTKHLVNFSDLDPYNHMGTGAYSRFFVDHRMIAVRDVAGWDLQALATLPFMLWVRRIEVDFVRPALGDQEITITSFVREFAGPDAFIECTMTNAAGKTLARCLMIVACVDKTTNRGMEWPEDAQALFFDRDDADLVTS